MVNIFEEPIVSQFWDKLMRWTMVLQQNPEWRQFNKEKMIYTLSYDIDAPDEDDDRHVFVFDEKTQKEHTLLMSYVELISCFKAIGQCEFYFRRFPFRDFPVSHEDYLTRNCEMFFNKIYEFRERIKNLGAAMKALSPDKHFDTGKLIKQYDKSFRNELKERNLLNHHTRFSDVSLTRFGILTSLEDTPVKLPFIDSSAVEYCRICRDWIKTVRSRTDLVKLYLVKLTDFLAANCDFLDHT